ncbi:unnamed protein product [Danaus chrysippus]|uniref:(African queen) hypothetical protein n=1 Tax=Danaus chrysippus TaxID=151541 RepID=A0A8J2R9E2_9NEOP|nr:unnamed protein product [Danaus chrysippus]
METIPRSRIQLAPSSGGVGSSFRVGNEVSSSTTLLEYLRRHLELRGTKYMCLEGGCGACIVNVVKSPGEASLGVNSCMVPITSCNGWDITTIEGIGNRLKGYHPIQMTLAENNGSQCGYCSPGWVMALYSILRNRRPTMLEIEQSFGSNICRCTGYRPILEAFKKFAIDYPDPKIIPDIEDLKLCQKTGEQCSKNSCSEWDWCVINKSDLTDDILHIQLRDHRNWFKATTVDHIFSLWQQFGTESYMLVGGNTGKGVVPILEYPKLLIDINHVPELHGYYVDQNLVIGASTTLTDLMTIFEFKGDTREFNYLNILNDHLRVVAHIAIRNSATIGGNLTLKNLHPGFQSDIYIILETAGAQLTILTDFHSEKVVSMQEFLKMDMTGKIIKNVILPPLKEKHKIVTFKVAPRSQNAHAWVHAGFHYVVDTYDIVLDCIIVYGGLSPNYTRSWKTEQYLVGKHLWNNKTLQGALNILNEELEVSESLPDPPVRYRRQAALGLFYKGLLALYPQEILNPRYISGMTKIHNTRPVSRGQQNFETNPALWPINLPIPKLEALIQCAGEAEYTEDLPTLPREVYAAFVLTTVPLGTITKIDASKALAVHGVIAFYTAADIPGRNSFVPAVNDTNKADEEVLCDGEVKYYNQPLGIIVGEYQEAVDKAVILVEVTYANVRQPVLDIAIAKHIPERVTFYAANNPSGRGNDIYKIIKGEQNIYTQYHFPIETIVGITQKTEEGIRVFNTAQGIDSVQVTTSRALLMDQSRIDVFVRRLGGAYGYKITRSTQVSIASSLIAYKLNRPCRFIQSLRANMRAVGKRLPASSNYEVAVNQDGVIQYVDYDLYSDNGYIVNETLLVAGTGDYNNAYRSDTWKYRSFTVTTDTPSNSWCRAPGSLEHVAMAETILERIAYEMNIDPFEIRLRNFDSINYDEMIGMITRIRTESQYDERKVLVEKFNMNNRWKKRGLKVSFLRWNASRTKYIDVNLDVYKDDGTVAITHGGIEMGQGMNTRAVQICASFLNIPLDKIQIKSTNTISTPNNSDTESSVTSQNVGRGVRRCCEELLTRLEPAKKQLHNPSWVELIQKAYAMNIDLQVHGFVSPDDEVDQTIYGVTVAEVEIDVLTGEWEILRVDLIEDVGRSINPDLDVGQIEGAFVMGLGYWTTENIVYEPRSGEILSDRTWQYWVPSARDIPQDFRIYFRKRSFSNEAFLGSKATGEPATCMAIVIPFAIRGAIASAREETGIPITEWFQIGDF